MAEENKAVKPEAPKENKFIAWCKNAPAAIAKPFKSMYHELKKVTWPSKRKWMVYSTIVLVFMLVMAVVVGLFDMGSSVLVQWLGSLRS